MNSAMYLFNVHLLLGEAQGFLEGIVLPQTLDRFLLHKFLFI
jgi:hypothetical protein